jgi:hypothetical protein
VRSARRAPNVTVSIAAGSCLLALTVLQGCGPTTTQEASARLRVKALRTLASQETTHLGKPEPDVRVLSALRLNGTGNTAVAVVLRNEGSRPVNDLPLAVGVQASGGSTEYVNLSRGTPYFQSHIPAIAPGATTTWVFTSKKAVPSGTVVAKVGTAAEPPTVADRIPHLDITHTPVSKGKQPATVSVHVTNNTGIPQYELAVFATARRGDQIVAAGRGAIAELDGGSTATVNVPLVGNPEGATIRATAPPTIFQ